MHISTTVNQVMYSLNNHYLLSIDSNMNYDCNIHYTWIIIQNGIVLVLWIPDGCASMRMTFAMVITVRL
jgi:hypothetical protein